MSKATLILYDPSYSWMRVGCIGYTILDRFNVLHLGSKMFHIGLITSKVNAYDNTISNKDAFYAQPLNEYILIEETLVAEDYKCWLLSEIVKKNNDTYQEIFNYCKPIYQELERESKINTIIDERQK